MGFTLRSNLCRIGWHRDLVKESRTFHRKLVDEGEYIDAYEQRECRCGYVFEFKNHSTTKITQPTTEVLHP